MTPERKIQNDILEYLRWRGALVFHVRNGATYDPKRHCYRANTSVKGVADIVGVLPGGRMIAVEVKSPKGKCTTEQLQFLYEVTSRGGLAMVARSVDDVAGILNETKRDQDCSQCVPM